MVQSTLQPGARNDVFGGGGEGEEGSAGQGGGVWDEKMSVCNNSDTDLQSPLLTVELVPSTSWYANVRSHLPEEEWDLVRRAVYRRARYRCEVCGGRGEHHPVECHEVWDYDDEQHVQRLDRLVALCPACHQVKHLGLASVNGRYDEALQHLADVNGWTLEEAGHHADAAFAQWSERSRHEWTVNLGPLESEAYHRWIARRRPGSPSPTR
jgi:hypothetical protein